MDIGQDEKGATYTKTIMAVRRPGTMRMEGMKDVR